jgi:hypothetical protein
VKDKKRSDYLAIGVLLVKEKPPVVGWGVSFWTFLIRGVFSCHTPYPRAGAMLYLSSEKGTTLARLVREATQAGCVTGGAVACRSFNLPGRKKSCQAVITRLAIVPIRCCGLGEKVI